MRLRGIEAGFVAWRLVAAGGAGHVMALFERSCYLALGDGLLCLGGASLGLGPLNLRTDAPSGMDWRALGLSPGTTVRCDTAGRLALGPRIVVAAGAAAPWSPPALVPGPPEVVAAALAELRCAARALAPHEGLGPLVLEAPELGDPRLMAAARTGLDALADWLRRGGPPPASIASLLGLGPGLTPSGDDLLGGALVALHALGEAEAARRLTAALAPLLGSATHAISRAHLEAAAKGGCGAALHALLGDLLAGRRDALPARLRAVDAVGHCSGWDGLAGAVMVLTARLAGRAGRRDAA